MSTFSYDDSIEWPFGVFRATGEREEAPHLPIEANDADDERTAQLLHDAVEDDPDRTLNLSSDERAAWDAVRRDWEREVYKRADEADA